MKTFSKIITLMTFAVLAFGVISCSRDSDSLTANDPLIGNWKLRVVTAQGQSTEVTNVSCWKNTTLNVDSKNAALIFIYPDQATGGCVNSSDSYQWTNSNGVYYYVENGQQMIMPVKLLDNNETLQLTITDNDGNTAIFSFRK